MFPVSADLLELMVFLVLEVPRVVQEAFETVLVLEVERAKLDLLAQKVSVATAVVKVPLVTKVPRVALVLEVDPVFLVVCVRRVRWDWLARRVTPVCQEYVERTATLVSWVLRVPEARTV